MTTENGTNLPSVEFVSGGIHGIGPKGGERFITRLVTIKETGAMAVAVVDYESSRKDGEVTAVAVPKGDKDTEGAFHVDLAISPTFTREALTHPKQAIAVEAMALKTLAKEELIPSPDGSGESIVVDLIAPESYISDPHSPINNEGADPQRTMDISTFVAHSTLPRMPNVVFQLAPEAPGDKPPAQLELAV